MTADWSLVATRGFSLFPIVAGTKRPALEWEPYQTRRPSPAELQAWAPGGWNTGVATGVVSGMVVLDLDNLDAWARALTRGLPDTLVVKTPRGWHYYFRHPGWPVSNRAHIRDVPLPDGSKGPKNSGWDIRGDGGYVLGPGSYFIPTPEEAEQGKVPGVYTLETDAPIAPLPEWLRDMLVQRVPAQPAAPRREADETTPYGRRAMYDELVDIRDAVPGTVNDQINASAFAIAQLVAGGEIRSDEAYDSLVECLAMRGLDGEEKATGTLERAWAAGLDNPRAAPAAANDPLAAFGTRPSPGAALQPPPPPSSDLEPPPPSSDPQFGLIVHADQIGDYFKGCVYVDSLDKIFLPHGRFAGKSGFDTRYGGRQFGTKYVENGKLSTSAWEAFRLNECFRPPVADDVCFRPEHPPGSIITVGNWNLLNTYVPANVRRVKGDPAPFLDFVGKLLPDPRDRDILLSYMAALVQNPGRKFQWWPVLQGAEGNGKTALLYCLSYAVGERYTHLPNPEAMKKTGNQFNSWIQGHLLIGVEEFHVEGSQRDFLNAFKTTVTNERIGIEGKGVNQGTGDNRANGIICTNYQDAIPNSVDQRRYAIFYTAQQSAADLLRDGMGGEYFPRFYDWLRNDGYAVVAEFLHTMPPVAEFNPAGMCQRAPRTSSFEATLVESHGRVEQEIMEAIDEDRPGFRGGAVSAKALTALFELKRFSVGPKRYKGIMAALGYVQHPDLPDGRVTAALADGSKPRLYFHKDHAVLQAPGAAAGPAYESAQAGGALADNVVPFPGRR